MTPDFMFLNYENVDTNTVGERLLRASVFSGNIVGISLKNISLSTMTVVDVLENFPHIMYLDVRQGVSPDVLGDMTGAANIINMKIPIDLADGLAGLPVHVHTLEITLDRPILSSRLLGVLRGLLKKREKRLILKIHRRDHLVSDIDIMSGIGDMDISLFFHKT
jgi:hypothetical protein